VIPKRIIPSSTLLVLLRALSLNTSHSIAAPLQAVEDFNVLLGRPTDHSITASVIPDQTAQISFEYGTTSGLFGNERCTPLSE
jgi:hypothetical protein